MCGSLASQLHVVIHLLFISKKYNPNSLVVSLIMDRPCGNSHAMWGEDFPGKPYCRRGCSNSRPPATREITSALRQACPPSCFLTLLKIKFYKSRSTPLHTHMKTNKFRLSGVLGKYNWGRSWHIENGPPLLHDRRGSARPPPFSSSSNRLSPPVQLTLVLLRLSSSTRPPPRATWLSPLQPRRPPTTGLPLPP
jgi:hypothetical protein